MEKLNYKIKEDVDLLILKNYGFYKTEPTETNPWWQCTLTANWSGLFGEISEQLLIDRDTRELFLDNKCNSKQYQKTIDLMLLDEIIH